MPSRDFQLHFCQSLPRGSKPIPPISTNPKTDWLIGMRWPTSLQAYMHEDPLHQKWICNKRKTQRICLMAFIHVIQWLVVVTTCMRLAKLPSLCSRPECHRSYTKGGDEECTQRVTERNEDESATTQGGEKQ